MKSSPVHNRREVFGLAGVGVGQEVENDEVVRLWCDCLKASNVESFDDGQKRI